MQESITVEGVKIILKKKHYSLMRRHASFRVSSSILMLSSSSESNEQVAGEPMHVAGYISDVKPRLDLPKAVL